MSALPLALGAELAAVPAAPAPRRDHLLVARMVEPNSRVLDVGCGDGALLALLRERRAVDGRGIELSREGVSHSLARGLAVVQGDADTDLAAYPDDAFDYVILSQTLQATRQPRAVLEHMLRIGRRAIVSFPNFGHWSVRWELGVRGRMPVTDNLPHSLVRHAQHPFLHDQGLCRPLPGRPAPTWRRRTRWMPVASRCGSAWPGGSGTCSANRASSCCGAGHRRAPVPAALRSGAGAAAPACRTENRKAATKAADISSTIVGAGAESMKKLR